MAHILIAAYGSRGDILPLTDIGCALRDAGHDVVLTAPPDLVDDITPGGLRVRRVEFEIDADLDASEDDALKLAMQMVKPKGMRQLGANLLTAAQDVPADLVLLSPFAELAGHPLAEARGIPSMGPRLQPMSTTAEFPPTLLGAWPAGRLGNRVAGRAAATWFDRLYGGVMADFRKQLGLPRRSARSLRRQRTAEHWPILHGYSPSVLARPKDWRPGLDVVGYWWPRRPADFAPPAELTDFLEAGPPPVYVGFGSLMVPAKEARRLEQVVRDALRAAKVRGIVQAGGAGLDVVDDDIRERLGVSAATLPRPKLEADDLAAAIVAAVSDSAHRERAESLAAAIRLENGAATVVAAAEARLLA